MNFLKLTLKGFLGAFAVLSAFSLFQLFVVFGYHPLALFILGVITLFKATFFAPIFAAVHLNRTPTFRSTMLTAIGFEIGAFALRFFLEPSYDALVTMNLLEVLILALVLGIGSIFIKPNGSQKPAP